MTLTVIEKRTYHRGGEHSYFQDLYQAQIERNEEAEARLQRHAVEYRAERAGVELEAVFGTAIDGRGDEYDFEVRANWTPGSGGYFAPPLWLIERFADIPRPAQVLARLLPKVPLPRGAQSINVPVLTSSTDTGPSPIDSDSPDTDLAGTANENPVVTIDGTEDVPQQLLEQSPQGAHLDWVIFSTLQAGYDEELERQLLAGSGAGQILGLSNVPGRTEISYAGPAKGTTLYPILGQAMAAVGNKRKVPPQAWLLSTSRWAWIGTAEDTQERPLLVTDNVGSMFPIGSLVGINAYLTDAMSSTKGGEVPIVLCVPQDLLLLESDPITRVMMEPGSGTMQARIQMHRYAAAITGRYPSGIAVVSGAGMVPVEHF